MPNALAQLRSTLQQKTGKPGSAQEVLRILAVDDVNLLHAIRMAVDTVRAFKLPVVRMGPFDDDKVAETGFFIAGPKTILTKLKTAIEAKAAKAGLPVLVAEHGVKEKAA